jgi:hypothetical protein
MTVDQLGDYLKHGRPFGEQLLNGTYEPKPVRQVKIAKPDGGGVRRSRSSAVENDLGALVDTVAQ